MFSSTSGVRVEFDPVSDLGTSLEDLIPEQTTAVTIESVLFCNKTGSTVTVSLCKTTGAGDFYYLHTFDVAAHQPYLFKDHNIVLAVGDTLRAKAGTGTAIDASAIGIQAVR